MARHFDRPGLGRGSRTARGLRWNCLIGGTLAALFPLFPAPLAASEGVPLVVQAAKQPPRPPTSLKLVIAATTDTHGRVRGWDYYTNSVDPMRGLTRVGTILDSLRAANPDQVVLVDAGDWLQGNPFTSAVAELHHTAHPVIAAMNALKYDAAVIGNHEFNYGVPFLDAAIKQARFPLLAGNVLGADGAARFPGTASFTRNGVKVAIIGATTPGAMIWDRDNLRAAKLAVTDIVPAVQRAVTAARNSGAEVVIVVLHSGLGGASNYDTASTHTGDENVAGRIPREVRGVDVVVFGHSHSELIDSTVNGTLLMQPKNWATSVGVATLSLEKHNGRWAVTTRKGQSIPAAGHLESKSLLAVTANAHNAAMQWANAPIGKTAVAWRSDSARVQDSPIIDFVAEVMRREAKADLASTTAFSLESRLDPGVITMAQLSQLYPYDNQLVAVRISGAQLRAFLEHSAKQYRTLNADGSAPAGGVVDNNVAGYNYEILSGADYVIDLRKPVGSRVTTLAFRGGAVRDDDSFTLALNSYHQNGAGGYAMLADLPRTYEKGTDIRGLLIAEVQRVGSINPADYAKQNWRIEPASAVAMSYAQQHRTQAKRTLRLITISDFHASLEARPDSRGRMLGGAVALQAALTQARNECKDLCTSITI
ncbi:MAG: 5'-nucleotidase C-terminal domain-containing protein, partial [Gemmatimonadaceae bacterium]